MKLIKLMTAAVVLLVFISCSKDDVNKKEGDPKQTDYSYAVGVQVGKNLKDTNVEIDRTALIKGIEDALNGKSDMTDAEIAAAFSDFSRLVNQKAQQTATDNLQLGRDFLDKNRSEKGIQTTSSGIQYKIIKKGAGRSPGPADRVKVNYRGVLLDGTEFDSSYARNEPVIFALNEVIRGWGEILQLMKPGANYKVFIPSELAYGPKPRPKIPGNSVLIFDIELLEILK
ncbi:MAG: FKBP-type peptidyl-prolyl cis-trans isomerase [Spirochaetes bacterium]|nr:FKBP-type peptidyl-prolyl cis-trans isomerase [Spirochaetota bacterium]